MDNFKHYLKSKESKGWYLYVYLLKYTSSKIQNEIILFCGDLILYKIVKHVNFG